MIHANPLRGISTGFSRISNPDIRPWRRLLFLSAAIAMFALAAGAQTNVAQTNNVPETSTPTARFQGLGQMPGDWPAAGTYTSGISGDGSTIMGYGWVCKNGGTKCDSSGTVQAYRWTAASGYQVLGTPGDSDFFGAGAVSFDGSVIVGEHPIPNNNSEAFRWTAAGMVQLPMLIASAVTRDGNMVAGGDSWWNAFGATGIFGPFAGNQDQTQALGLAGTGLAPIAVGAAFKGSDNNGPTDHAFRWTPGTGLQDLGVTTGTQSIAIAASEDGSVVVGEATDGSGFWRAFRWTAATGMVDIGTLGGPESAAYATNKDGSVIVGTTLTSSQSDSNACFIWTAQTGMQNFKTMLDDAGVHAADKWTTLDTLNGISADGTVVVGYGQSPPSKGNPFGEWEPFRAVLPPQ
jgi:probable HAF family extracellular repeat protein